ncbi:hypothetical protein H109_00154 [Trichophyton interdigitale MR816]|uniref:Uncharacterized protein n=1 Tax=Trichophyton interdigitale (strain MR816) TaxID=1215338 RepID=A0A059JJD7_TRIIM|nr:hypothetical protein H101_01377 [Trichophyton interdigitale H6]KDB28006.1 hypothetical protein H109_00154 [Trichophyton interdigitale MR816]
MSSQGRQLSSLAPIIQSKESPKNPNVSSPASLLWAHQLHREQNALSTQILELESSLKSSIAAINDSVLAKLDAFTGQIDHLRSEVEQLRRDGPAEAEKVVRSVEDKLSEKFSAIDERLSTAFARDYEMTSEMVREEVGRLRDEIVEAFKAAVAESRQQQQLDTLQPRQSALSPILQQETRLNPAMEQSTLTNPLPQHETQPVIVWQDKVQPLSTVPSVPIEKTLAQPRNAVNIDIDTRGIDRLEYTVANDTHPGPPQLIMQGPIPLSDFLELGPAYITLGYDESQIAMALWKGLNDPFLRRLVAKEMPEEYDRWTYPRLDEVVRRLNKHKEGIDKEAETIAVKPTEGRKKKRRRVISVVWPTDEECC